MKQETKDFKIMIILTWICIIIFGLIFSGVGLILGTVKEVISFSIAYIGLGIAISLFLLVRYIIRVRCLK